MIPGAEAVRPIATNQSPRAGEILSELVNPSPEALSLGQSLDPFRETGPFPNEETIFKNGALKLIRTDFRDEATGTLYLRTWERYRDGGLKRKVDEIYDPSGELRKRQATLFDSSGSILKKESDLDLDGHPDESWMRPASAPAQASSPPQKAEKPQTPV